VLGLSSGLSRLSWITFRMDTLKALLGNKRKAAEEEFKGKKYVKRGDIEDARLRKLREEEEKELREKVSWSSGAEATRTTKRTERCEVLFFLVAITLWSEDVLRHA
jgi:hypothetical protein